MHSTNLRRLFAPTSVAVVGASSSSGKAGHEALKALETFGGEVFPINPKAEEVLGRKAFPSLAAVGRPVDLVLFAIPAGGTVDAVREAIACKCGGGLILSGGFAESGEPGARIQTELEALCTRSEFRVLGPNTAGFVNRQLPLTASFLPGAARIPSGEVAVVAQSAGVNLTVSFLLAKLGYGVSFAVGLGNAIDVGAADVLDFLAEQPGTKAIALHLEGVTDGRRLYESVRRITPKKPVVVLTVGRQDIGEFAQSHTGRMIGSFALRSTALRQAGAVVVESTEELAASAAALSLYRLRPTHDPGIGMLTAQAGPGLLMLDQLKSRGVSVPSLTSSTLARIAGLLPPMTYAKNPIDTGRPGASFGPILAALSEDPHIDAVIAFALHEPAALDPASVIPSVSARQKKPIAFGTMGARDEIEPVVRALRAHDIYVAESPEQLARTACALVEDAANQARLDDTPRPDARRGAVDVPATCDEHSAKRMLEALGIPAPKRMVCTSRARAHQAFQQLSKPIVAKILSPDVVHKTEVCGVQLDIADETALDQALDVLDEIELGSPRRYLIEEMAPPGFEVIVGAVRDASFGPTVLVGLGGTLAEVLDDRATRLAPLSLDQADRMLSELRCATMLDGFRGGPRLDRAALARSIVNLGNLLCTESEIEELEINPLRVYPEGVLALDAVLITGRTREPTR